MSNKAMTTSGADGTPPTGSVAAAPAEAAPPTPPRDVDTGRLRRRTQIAASFALPSLLLALIVLFSLLQPDTFATFANLRAVLLTQSVLAVLSIAVLLPLIIGEFDLSVGANLGLGAIAVTGLISKQHFSLTAAVILGVVICTVTGLINGLLVAKVRINAFIATLGTGTLISGVVLWYSDSTTISEGLPDSLTAISRQSIAGVPLPAIYLLIIALVVWYLLDFTPLGRYLYALGGSKDASRLAGLNVDRLTILTFTATGLLCGIGGVIEAAGLGIGNPSVGPPLLLPAFAAAFLGATAFKVGTFNVWGTLLAVFTLAAGITGLNLIGVAAFIEPLFNGGALIIAVTATRYLQREAI